MVLLMYRGLQFPVSLAINSLVAGGGGLAWLPWRVSCRRTDELGTGRGIWLGSIFDGPETAFPLGPVAGDIVAIDC